MIIMMVIIIIIIVVNTIFIYSINIIIGITGLVEVISTIGCKKIIIEKNFHEKNTFTKK